MIPHDSSGRSMTSRRIFSRTMLLCCATLLCGCTGSSFYDALDWGECDSCANEYAAELEASGALMSSVPDTAASYPMAVVLSQAALNSLFRRLADVDLPELVESTEILGQRVGVSVRPALPLLQIGGTGRCTDCISATVPFDVGLSMAGIDLPRGAGSISVQMPVRLVPEGDTRTALVAQFQSIEVTGLQIDFVSALPGNIHDAVEPVINTLLTRFVRLRFEDARIVTLDTWSIGRGEVLLAGRGPFVYPEAGTIVVALQSNLPLQSGTQLQPQAELPPGAELGVLIHPALLGAMARRMLFENVIPQAYDEQGTPEPDGAIRATLQTVSSSDDGLLQASATLWRTGNMCGAVDLNASIAFNADTRGVTFTLRNLDMSNPRGSGQVLARANDLASGFIDRLVETLSVTVNYDAIFGGEQRWDAEVATFRFGVDGRGVSLYLDLAD